MVQVLRPLLSGLVEQVAVVPAGCRPVVVAIGSADSVRVTPGQVLRPVLLAGASSYLLAHTHPHGGPPSLSDLAVTRRLVAAGTVLGVHMTAHVVLAPDQHWDCLAA